jgi:hypothetical protein
MFASQDEFKPLRIKYLKFDAAILSRNFRLLGKSVQKVSSYGVRKFNVMGNLALVNC